MTAELFYQVLTLVLAHAVAGAVARWAMSEKPHVQVNVGNNTHFLPKSDTQ